MYVAEGCSLGARRSVPETRNGEVEEDRTEEVDGVTRDHLGRLARHRQIGEPDGCSPGERIEEIYAEPRGVLVDEESDRYRPSGASTIFAHEGQSFRRRYGAHGLDAEAVGNELAAHPVRELIGSFLAARLHADEHEQRVGTSEARAGHGGEDGEPDKDRTKVGAFHVTLAVISICPLDREPKARRAAST